MTSGNPFAAALLVATTFGSGSHGIRPARIEHAPHLLRVDTDVTVISGKLARPVFTHGLFRIGPLWFQVPSSNAPFHEWLLQARGRQAAVTLTTNGERFADAKNTQIVSGTPVHETVPSVSPIVHLMFLRDTVTGSAAVTFQTTDVLVGSRLETYMGDSHVASRVSVIIQIE
jgi:hypothetical protein